MPNSRPVLVVEDEEDSVILLERAFRKAAVVNPIRAVSDGVQAIDFLSKLPAGSPAPVITLLDLKMPRKGGIDVLNWVRSHPELKSLVVIVFTSSKQKDDIERAYQAGANSYLVKPTSMHDLTELIMDVRNYWFKHNQAPVIVA